MSAECLLNFTRLIVAALYVAAAVASARAWHKGQLATTKIVAGIAFLVSFVWATFYIVLTFISPLSGEEITVASLMSRLNHLPTIGAIFIMLSIRRLTEKTMLDLQKETIEHGGS